MDSNQTHSQGAAAAVAVAGEAQHLVRLCDLVADSLLPHLVSNSGHWYLVAPAFPAGTEPPATRQPQLTREDERRVLLALAWVIV
jgi:hypothetical protein